jgi:hypothetical protein
MATQDDNARSADAAGDPPLTLDELAERERARREAADTSGARPSAGQELLLSGPTEREPGNSASSGRLVAVRAGGLHMGSCRIQRP